MPFLFIIWRLSKVIFPEILIILHGVLIVFFLKYVITIFTITMLLRGTESRWSHRRRRRQISLTITNYTAG